MPAAIAPIPDFPATHLAFRDDAYETRLTARVIDVHEHMLVLDQTIFYPSSGGQPSDFGSITRDDGVSFAIGEMRYLDPAKTIVGHRLPDGEDPSDWNNRVVTQALDFERRYKLMRMHSALHLLSVALPFAVTGGSVGTEGGRLDFDIPEAGFTKEEVTEKLNALIAQNAPITERWITDAELDANPSLVKTMSVKPPRGAGRVRLVEIAGLDLQPCGGTHVRNTREIGRVAVINIEKKGKQNRRVRIAFA
ncbi:MAG TPA: alanyl-tRNA editing protein [Rhabdaerophilum sp.]|nr:alanyl-tRNA editing protein [Rhabdaerophilum sp.]